MKKRLLSKKMYKKKDETKNVVRKVEELFFTDCNNNKICCIFDCPSVEEAAKKIEIDKQLKTVEDYGSNHLSMYDLDYGDRQLMKCKKCGALILRQYSHCPCYYDGYPLTSIVYCSVSKRAEVVEINEKYNGYEFEYEYLKKGENAWIKSSTGKWNWSKDEAKRKKTVEDIVEAARTLAKELHQGQTDKAGKDYFSGHLCHVAEQGEHWTAMVVGYLHDAAEDKPYSVEQVMQMLQEKCDNQLCKADAKGIQEALNLLNSKTASSREEYINRISPNNLAACVKMKDLRHNMDISRIENSTEKDFERAKRYQKEYERLFETYSKVIDERIDKLNS